MATKADVVRQFKSIYKKELAGNDLPLKRMLWNDYTDQLQKNGEITEKQRMTWDHPKY